MYITYVDTQTPSEDGINIYHDHPAKRNLQLAGESKTDTKDSSSYHCVGPSSSKEAGATGTGAPKKHHYQEVHSLRLGDRYEVHHPEGEFEIKIATAYETPITRKERVSRKIKKINVGEVLSLVTIYYFRNHRLEVFIPTLILLTVPEFMSPPQ